MAKHPHSWPDVDRHERSDVLVWWLNQHPAVVAVLQDARIHVTSVVTEDPNDLGMRWRLGACTIEIGVVPRVGDTNVWLMVIETRRESRHAGHARRLLEVLFDAFRGWSICSTPIVAIEPAAHPLARLLEELSAKCGCRYFAPHIDPTPAELADGMYDELGVIDPENEDVVFDGQHIVWHGTAECSSCARCGTAVPISVTVIDKGERPESGSSFSYCSDGCLIRH